MKTYSGGCHCGAVAYEVDLEEPIKGMECNCSICSTTGTVLTFAPASNFRLQKGEEDLTDYLFYKKHIHHLFCKHCGIRSFARGAAPDGSMSYAVNLRCLKDLDLSGVERQFYDGKGV